MPPKTVVCATPVMLITGGARRVGAVIAEHLHQQGAHIAIHCRRSLDAAQQLANRFNAIRPDSAAVFQSPLNSPVDAEQLIEQVIARFKQLDGLVNNASSFFPTPIGSIDEAAWNDLVGSNFKAPLWLCQAAALPLQTQRGAIVNITDIHAERPLAGYPLYSAAKGALLTLTKALAIELAPAVRVNAVAPGPILWPEDGQFSASKRDAILAHTLLKREGKPIEIAQAVSFLLLNATYMTGQVLNVDGGRTAHL